MKNLVYRLKAKASRILRSKGVLLGFVLISWFLVSPSLTAEKSLPAVNSDLEHHAPTRFAPYFSGRPLNALVGGYMTLESEEGDYILSRAKAVKLSVSFNGTEDAFHETIQSDNYLGLGIAISGPDYLWGSTLSIDWAYSYVMFVNSSGGPFIQIEIWKAFEFFNYAEKVVSVAYSNPAYLQLNSTVTLKMEWDEELGNLNYFISVEGKPDLPSPIFQYHSDVEDSCKPYFYLTPSRSHAFVRYFQIIGAWSAYSISSSAWVTHLYSPEFVFLETDTWEEVATANSLSGGDALLDSYIRWGGVHYKDAYIESNRVNPQVPPNEIRFYSKENIEQLQEGSLILDPDTPSYNLPSRQSDSRWAWVTSQGPYISVVIGSIVLVFTIDLPGFWRKRRRK